MKYWYYRPNPFPALLKIVNIRDSNAFGLESAYSNAGVSGDGNIYAAHSVDGREPGAGT